MDRRSAVDARGLQHRFLKVLKEFVPEGSRILVAVSGGVDSVVLLDLLCHWRRRLKLQLAVAHVHHGATRSSVQHRYRQKAAKVVAEIARESSCPFHTNDSFPARPLKGEAELRDWRRQFLLQEQQVWSHSTESTVWIATAHTADDQLETRLLRLIRGTGREGLHAIRTIDGPWLRLLLNEQKSTLIAYAKKQMLSWFEDPSNRSEDPMRNWLRGKWLPQLAKRFPAGPQLLQRSLENVLAEPDSTFTLDEIVHENGVSRPALIGLSRPDQRRVLAHYLRQVGLQDYTSGHVEELLKRLDTGRRELTFKLVGRQWRVSPHWIAVQSQ